MASKYVKEYKVPYSFENILNDFSKEILRNQPKDIIVFGIQYFKGLEEKLKFDYKDKGDNLPENYKRPDNQDSNIIHAPNNIILSIEDSNRLGKSIDKKSQINNAPVAVKGNEKHKKEYDDWFNKHSIDKQVIDYKPEEENLDDYLNRNEDGYKTWFNNHSGRSIVLINSGEEKVTKGNSREYSDWFNRHSGDKLVIDYKPEEKKNDENITRCEVDFPTWFENHSKITNKYC